MVEEGWVVKIGGREIRPGEGLEAFSTWASPVSRRRPLVVVHGGGEEVTARAEALGMTTTKVAGQRVTTPEVLPILIGVLAGEVNLRLVHSLLRAGLTPVGLTGISGDILRAEPSPGSDFGLVGDPVAVNAPLLRELLALGLTPVLSPLASDGAGGVLNVNADHFAAAVAESLGYELIILTDVSAVTDGEGHPVGSLTPCTAEEMIRTGEIHGGMVPKVRAALRALSGGIGRVWIGDMSQLLSNPAFPTGGTVVVPDSPDLPHTSPQPQRVEGR